MASVAPSLLPYQDQLDALRRFSQVDLQPSWQLHLGDLSLEQALSPTAQSHWPTVELNDRAHVAWNAGKQVVWLGQQFTVPEHLYGYEVVGHQIRLDLTWWADDAEIFVNGERVQEGDLFDCVTKFRLSSGAKPGQRFDLAIRLMSPGHDRGALVLSQIRFEAIALPQQTCPEPGFVADELTVLGRYLQQFEPAKLAEFETALAELGSATTGQSSSAIVAKLAALRQQLQPLAQLLQQRHIDLLGHAHLDMAWLWPVAETWQAAEQTFESALTLQAEFPALTFGHSSPALYAWIQQHRPELFARIKQAIAAGRWEVIAGPWIEPDCVLPSGESLVRQLLYGQLYVEQELGVQNRVAWLPDSFGFCNQLPQILKQAGVDYFVTEKLLWNDTTQFPHQLFNWRSPDGTEITSYMSARIGTQIAPVQMADYAVGWEAATGEGRSLWLPGVGDHGGGPTREMLETAERWQDSPFFPQMDFATVHDYLDGVISRTDEAQIPRWDQDLYLEYHRGCYTSHADQKQYNRESEALLYEAELWSSLATLALGADYPKAEIEALWKRVLFNQFHDILPGSSIPEVFKDADRDWKLVLKQGREMRERALRVIAAAIALPDPPQPGAVPYVIFNSLNWARSAVVALPTGGDWQAWDSRGKVLAVQSGANSKHLVQTPVVAGVGYGLIWLGEGGALPLPPAPNGEGEPEFMFENRFLRVEVDAETGDLAQVHSKALECDILGGPGNQLQAFRDQGQYWDAWNIDPEYEQHRLADSELISIDWIARGSLEWRVRVKRRISHSICQQDYVLQAHSPLLRIETEIDWQEDYVLLKAAFPLALDADELVTEVPHGVISRTTRPQTEAEKAQWEVPALRWADLSTPATAEEPWGVSVLNDCKYGYDAGPNRIRLTLLRASNWPDPGCDRGLHHFTYALHAHSGNWQTSGNIRHGYELQHPLSLSPIPTQHKSGKSLPSIGELLFLGDSGLVLTALKQSETDPNRWILHSYESLGQPAQAKLSSDLGATWGDRTNGLEKDLDSDVRRKTTPSETVSPFEIATVRIEQPDSHLIP